MFQEEKEFVLKFLRKVLKDMNLVFVVLNELIQEFIISKLLRIGMNIVKYNIEIQYTMRFFEIWIVQFDCMVLSLNFVDNNIVL